MSNLSNWGILLTLGFGLVEVGIFVIGFLIGNRLENTKRRQYKNWKMIFTVLTLLGSGTIVSYSLDEIFQVSSLSFVAFWIGLLLGYFGTRTRKEILRSRLELFRGFVRAGTSKS